MERGWHEHEGRWLRQLGLIAVTAHDDPQGRGWVLQASHGEPPRGFFATPEDAQKAGDRHMRAQLERTLSLLTRAEDEPPTGRPRPCGLVMFGAQDDIAALRKRVLAALHEVM